MTMNGRYLGTLANRMIRTGIVLGIVGIGAGLVMGWGEIAGASIAGFFRSYLTAFIFCLSIALGGFLFTLIHHATRAGWSVVLRRLIEGIASNLTWLWILFIPILVLAVSGHGDMLYTWLDTDHHDAVLAHKAPYLNLTFWIVRAVIFLGGWALISRFYFRSSVLQDEIGGTGLTHLMQKYAPICIVLYALTQTLAAVDWIMSLDAHWFSTMFGVYFFAASCCGFFAFLIILVHVLQLEGRLTEDISLEHWQDIGKFLFAFGVVFHAYIGFSQYMLIWYGNIPEETGWYLARIMGGWKSVFWLLLFGHFVCPFVLLVSKHSKRIKPVLVLIALWMLAMHYVDMYLLIMPRVPTAQFAAAGSYRELADMVQAGTVDLGYRPHLMDLACLLGMVGFFVAGLGHRLRSCSLVPLRDPRLAESLAFENI